MALDGKERPVDAGKQPGAEGDKLLIKSYRPRQTTRISSSAAFSQPDQSKTGLVSEINNAGKLLQQLSERLETARITTPGNSRRGSLLPTLRKPSVVVK